MEQDVNRIIENVGTEWAGALAAANRKIAIIAEENRLLAEENKGLKSELNRLKDRKPAEK